MVVMKDREATVRTWSRADMVRERKRLLAVAAMTEEELRARGEAWELDAEHRGILSQIDGLDFLLAHTPE